MTTPKQQSLIVVYIKEMKISEIFKRETIFNKCLVIGKQWILMLNDDEICSILTLNGKDVRHILPVKTFRLVGRDNIENEWLKTFHYH